MRRNLRRSVRTSLGRYIAIAAIIALGAGLFCGLRVTKKDMVATVQRYTDQQNMFDLRVMNTYGWTQDDVLALREVEGIADAEGSQSVDALLHFEAGEDSAYKLLSIPERVNRISLNAGRLPQSGDEVLADGFFMDESVIGQCIYLSDANEDDTLDALTYDCYTIVGLTATPLYLNMQRGSTTIGSGALAAYLYLPPEGFDLEVYTEISLTLVGTHEVYTDEYDDAMDAMADRLELLAQPMAEQRYADVLSEAEDAYESGRVEYLEGLAEFHQGQQQANDELDKARRELIDGEKEIADNRAILLDGQSQLEAAEQTLSDSLSALADSRSALAQSRTEVYAQLAQGYNELFENYRSVLDGIKQADAGLIQIDSGITQLESGLTQLETGLNTIEIMLPILNISIEAAQSALDQIQNASDKPDFQEQLAQAQAKLDELTAKRDEYLAQKEELLATRTELETQLAQLKDQREDVIASQAQLEEAKAALDLGFKEADNAQVQAENQFAAAEAQLDAAENQIEVGQQTLASQKEELAEGLAALETAEQELLDGKAEFEKEEQRVLKELEQTQTELEEARTQLQEARSQIDEMEPSQVYVLTRNTNVGYVVFESDSDIVAGVAKIFPAFFLAVAALVCITTMTRMVDEERTQIGVLKALGYSSFSIMWKYLAYSGSSALLGCGLGVLAGSVIFPQIIWYAYCIMYNFSDQLVLTLDYSTIAFILLSYTGLTLLVTWYCCRQSLREVPAQLMRPKSPSAGKKVILEKLPIWGRLKFLDKVAIRNIFRYRQRMVMMLMGIGGCTALLVTGFGLRDSVLDITNYQFENVTVYDMSVTFSEAQTQAQQDAFRTEFRGRAEQILFVEQSGVDLEYGTGVKSVNLLSVDRPLAGFIDLHSGSEAIADPGLNQAVISVGTAKAMGISVGDTIVVRDTELREMELTVSGIFDNYVYNYVIVGAQTLRQQWGREPELSCAYVVSTQQQDVHTLGAAMAKYKNVLNVSINQDTADTVGGMMSALDAVVALVVICAGLLAGIVLYNLTNINIKERVREIATIKVLGFNAGETGSYVFKENLALTAMGIVVGLLGGKLLHAMVMSYVQIDMVTFPVQIKFLSYVLSALLTMVAALLVDFVMYFQLDRINMAEALKSVE